MAITLQFSPELEAHLQERARQSGIDLSAYIEDLLARTLGQGDMSEERSVAPIEEVGEEVYREKDFVAKAPHAGMTFREILAPSQEGFDQTGMTDGELAGFVEERVKALRIKRRERERLTL